MSRIKVFENNSGSILVGAVALAILMAIAGMGFLLTTTNGINNETAAFENEKAFQAAESGVWIGARWLRSQLAFPSTTAASADIGPFGGNPVSINGMKVYITIPVQIVNTLPVASIVSEVYNGAKSAATFKKRISVGDVRNQGLAIYTTFYDGYQPVDATSWDAVNNKWKLDWGGWGANRNFFGRVHLNSMPVVLNTNQPRFFGLVTVAKGNPGLGAGFENGGHDGNNYDDGVVGAKYTQGAGYSPTLAELDNIFTARYTSDVDPIVLNIVNNDATTLQAAVLPTADTKVILPASDRDDGYGPYQYRPTLYFNLGSAYYQYHTAGGYQVQRYGTIVGGSINNTVFLSLNNNLNVFTTANGATGNVTVATAAGRSIVPVGNIITSDFNPSNNPCISTTSTNMIGLISGGYIAFNKTWERDFVPDGAVYTTSDNGTDVIKYVSEKVTGGADNDPPGGRTPAAVGTMYISAAIMAVCHFNDNLYTGAVYQTYPMSGTEWWDGMWGQYPVSPNGTTFNDHAFRGEDYGYYLYGNHILGAYSRSIYGIPQRGCQGSITFNVDARMTDYNLQPPGFPGVVNQVNGVNLLSLQVRNWSEQNTQ